MTVSVTMSVRVAVRVLTRAAEEQQTDDVDEQTQDGHDQVQHAMLRHTLLHLADVEHARQRLHENVEADGKQEHTVNHGTDHLEAAPAVGVVLALGTASQGNRPVTDNQRDQIGRHVHGIGLQSQRIGNNTTDELDNHEAARHAHHHHQTALIVLCLLNLLLLRLHEHHLVLVADVVLSLLVLRLGEIHVSARDYVLPTVPT